MSRPFDIVIYGATGYTAGLTIDYLLTSKAGATYKWAIAGRSKEKLEAVLADKKKAFPSASVDPSKVPVLTASVEDDASLDALCKQTTVLLAMAGPFIKCGPPIVAACVRNSTHYLDITGEFQFIRQAIEKHHSEAASKKIAIVNCCGFDCVPSDIGSLMMHDVVSKLNGAPSVTNIVAYFQMRGATSASGGTAHSIATIFDTITAADLSPVSLNPPNARKGVNTPSQKFIGRADPPLNMYTAPFLMAGGNERIVRRSNALLGRPTSIYYEAAASTSFFGALGTLVSFYLLGGVMAIKPLRWLCTKFVLPKQGHGPSAEAKKDGGFTITFIATASNGTQYKGVWEDSRNPYDSTATYIVEAAATLLESIKSKESIVGGVLTPASAFGMRFLNRLLKNDPNTTVHTSEMSKSK